MGDVLAWHTVMASKQLILLLDGTWNDADEGPSDTNIVRLRELLNRSLENQPISADAGGKALVASRVYTGGPDNDNRERYIFYERGVGTGALLDQFVGGAFGSGLGDNVRRAYKFLSRYYQLGDDIFVFGFSRGAYTARSLVGMIEAAGLLKREFCNAANEQKVWDNYRTSENDRLPTVEDELKAFVHDRNKLLVACVGVFDTVGSLGVPLPVFRRKNRDIYGFHNVELGSITKINLHALAIDEHREPFQAATWLKPKFKAFRDDALRIEQVWFPGAHGDIGGGYISESERQVKNALRRQALDDITLDWMLRRLLHYFPDFPIKLTDPKVWPGVTPDFAKAPQFGPRTGMYCLRPFINRSINNNHYDCPAPRRRTPFFFRKEQCLGYDRHAEPIGEMVHISALHRYGEIVSILGFGEPGTVGKYRPRGLRSVLPFIGKAYKELSAPTSDKFANLLVVNWDGDPIPTDPCGCEKVRKLLMDRLIIREDYLEACNNL
jgi:Uncharacterized alpha/beta hydrolase domain (DUF2235)